MEELSVYTKSIIISLVIIASYFFNYVSKKTNIPSVLMLIGVGVGGNELMKSLGHSLGDSLFDMLELLGVVGLIMIVLEAALDLKLEKEKKPLLIRSFFVALLSLVVTSIAVAFLFNYFIIEDFLTSLLYAIPLAILSSAIIIPSVGNLMGYKKEFLIFDGTFSDILGIMFFYFLIGGAEMESTGEVILSVTGSILITIILSLIVSYALVLLLQRLQSQVKLFFFISILILLYATGKMFHLSSLLIIMVFGLVLNNTELFFKGKLKNWIDSNRLKHLTEDFHVVTMESAFVVRSFFFVVFGMTLDFSGITNLEALGLSGAIIVISYLVRYIFLKIFEGKNILPQLWIAPKGLITVLLFFSIPKEFISENFNSAILLIVILASNFIMSLGLMIKKEGTGEEVDELNFDDWDELDKEIEALSSKA